MSETDKGTMGLPPCDVFRPDHSGVVAWSPVFDRVEVVPGLVDPAGGRFLIFSRSGQMQARIPLDAAAAAHLAALLSDAPRLSPIVTEEVA